MRELGDPATHFDVTFFSAAFSISFLRISLAFSIRNFPAASTSPALVLRALRSRHSGLLTVLEMIFLRSIT